MANNKIKLTTTTQEKNLNHKHEKTLPHDYSIDNCEDLLIEAMPPVSTVETVADALKQLGDPNRLRIFWLLCHCEECVINIASLMEMSSPAVSHHLKLLKISGLIVSKRHGKEMFYKAADTAIVDKLHHTIEEIAEITCPKR